MTAAVLEGTRRARILAHLAEHPDLTSYELGRAIGSTAAALHQLLKNMEAKAQVVSMTQPRPGQSRPVRIWRIAPPGTVPPPPVLLSASAVAGRRAAWRADQRRRRARSVVTFSAPFLPAAPACRSADPFLFFGPEGEDGQARAAREAKAIAICAACPVRAACLEYAQETGQVAGVWGGVSFEPAEAGR